MLALVGGCATGPERHTFDIDQMIPNEDGTVTLRAPELAQFLREKIAYEAAPKAFAKAGEPGGPSGPPAPKPPKPPTPKPPYPKPPGPSTGPGPDKPGQVVIFDF
jgi:hypothetical protein